MSSFQRSEQPGPGGAVGIGGWLSLLAIGVVVTPFTYAYIAFVYGRALHHAVSSQSIHLNQTWVLAMQYVIGSSFFMAVYSGAVAWFFFAKKRHAPLMMISVYVLALVNVLMKYGLTDRLPQTQDQIASPTAVVRTCLVGAIWTVYLLNSDRVAATFTE
jgi:hypothetical protein